MKAYARLSRAGRAVARAAFVKLVTDYRDGEQPSAHDGPPNGYENLRRQAFAAVRAANAFDEISDVTPADE